MSILSSISGYLGLQVETVELVANRAPTLYRRYRVPKKKGGMREIFHPAKETKTIQLAVIDLLYRPELQHEAARGYVRGLKAPLFSNAVAHSKNPFLLKLDFADYFPSIKPSDFELICCPRLLLHGQRLSSADIELLKKILFISIPSRGSFLAIGAPSSPFISNWVMYNLDQEIDRLCREQGCVYTRYADDICISSGAMSDLLRLETTIQELICRSPHPKLSFNDKKRRLASPWSRRCITGLVLTPKGEVKVPRSVKRLVRTLLHNSCVGSCSPADKRKLSGYLAYINDCEPNYTHNLVMKFGAEVIERARRPE